MPIHDLERISRICHEAVRAYARGLGDFTIMPWEITPVWKQDVVRKGVTYCVVHDHPGPEAAHTNWVIDMGEQGWTWGAEKNEALKTHPCILPYERLPHHQRIKDDIFCAIIKASTYEKPIRVMP